jgi:hypothetical protein
MRLIPEKREKKMVKNKKWLCPVFFLFSITKDYISICREPSSLSSFLLGVVAPGGGSE